MKIRDIVAAPWNTRTAITEESVKALAESIKADGLIQPISVCDAEDGKGYVCYDGNRRLAACKLLGMKEIDAHYTDITIDEAKVRTVTANLQREEDDPLLVAGVIKDMLAGGMDAQAIAAKLGKTVGWVTRRRKLIGASEALKDVANKVTVEALEQIAVLPEATQKRVVTEVIRMAGYMGTVGAKDIRRKIELESRDLETSGMSCEKCKGCASRTGAEADLFNEVRGLGRCLDAKCFERMLAEHQSAEVKRVAGDAEAVICNSWNVPREANAKKRDKKHPCAYVTFERGETSVVWGPSKKAIEERRKREDEARYAKVKGDDERRKRINGITNMLYDYFDVGREDVSVLEEHAKAMLNNPGKEVYAFIVNAIVEALCVYRNNQDWANFLRLFGWAAGVAGVSEEDAKFLMDEFSAVRGGEAATDGEEG